MLMNKSSWKIQDKRLEVRNLHLGAHPGFLNWAVRRALLGGYMLRARRLEGYSASARRLNGGNTLPRPLEG
jgi:hypothetical protein